MRWGLAAGFFDRPGKPAPLWARSIVLLAYTALLSAAVVALILSGGKWQAFWEYRRAFFQGWLVTIELSVCALIGSTLLGVLTALSRRAAFLPLRYLATLYVELVRGLPFLVLILILFYTVPWITQHGDRFSFGVLALSIFAGAYIAEIVRAGIESIGGAQWESARAIGLTPLQTYRYIVYPQALKYILPPLTGQFASLIKDSSLLSVIGLVELTQRAQQVFSATYSANQSFLALGLGYLILTLAVSAAARALGQRLR